MTITDFSNINRGMQMTINRLLTREEERKALIKPIVKIASDGVFDYHVITEDIIVTEQRNIFKKNGDENAQYDSYFETYVKGKRVLKTGTFTLNNAILLGLAAMENNEDAYPFVCKAFDMVE